MTRPRPVCYAGATGAAIDPAAGLGLDPDRYGWQLKSDGLYCQITTGTDGRIDSVSSQIGRPIAGSEDLLGIHAAPPFSTLVGEYTGHTESGAAESAARGYAVVHLFDCLRLAGVPLGRLPYRERHGSLYRAQSWVEGEGLARRREWTTDAQGDAHDDAGRYHAAIPRDLRRLPIAPTVRGRVAALELWSRIERDGLEGAVAVDLRAPVGARGAKRKIKITDGMTCTVIDAGPAHSLVSASTARGPLTFAVPGAANVGAAVEVAHHGYYVSGLPRFPRIVRARTDRGALVEWRA